MDWAAIRLAVQVAVVSASGIQDVAWMGTSEWSRMRQDPHVDLKLRAPQAIGIDETRYDFDDGGDKLVPSQCGQRTFIVEVRIERESQLNGEETVGQLAGQVRTRIRREGVLAALRVANLAVALIGPTAEGDFTADGRSVSAAITEFTFNACENDPDTTADGDYIKSVDFATDKLNDPAGAPLPDAQQINLTVEAP